MRTAVAIIVAFVGVIGIAAASEIDASVRKPTSIAPQPLGSALASLARERQFQVLYRTEVVGDARTEGVNGDLSLDEALSQLLAGTGLSYRFIDEKTVKVYDRSQEDAAGPRGEPARKDTVGHNDAQDSTVPLRVAQAEAGDSSVSGENRPADAAAQSAGAQQPDEALEEILVTAQKRVERLQDVPAPVTAISADTLVENSMLRLSSYFDKIPGFALSPGPRGEPFLSIRGINTNGAGNPNVGVVVDDVPFGATKSSGGGSLTPDMDPSQLARIEVLRGPQGTLYGAASMGGLLKYVTVDPSTTELTGRIQSDINTVRNGEEVGYGLRGNMNVPFGDSFALGVSGFTRQDPGYVDDPVLGIRGINSAEANGGRIAALWRPSETFSVKLAALLQTYDRDGSPEVHEKPALSDLEQNAIIGAGKYATDMNFYSATVNARLGSVDVTAISGYNVVENDSTIDFGLSAFVLPLFGVSGALFTDENNTDKFSQEIRASIPVSEKIEWLIGGFYSDESSRWFQHVFAIDPITGVRSTFDGGPQVDPGEWYDVILLDTFKEYAAFTNLAFKLTDRFDIQLGGRQSQNKQTYSLHERGLPILVTTPGGENLTPPTDSDEDSFTYLATARYRVSPDLMTYVRLASGYRPGGPNRFSAGAAPISYGPDTTRNYEIGVKGNVFGGATSFDVSVYRIDWNDIQYNARVGLAGFITNGNDAKSEGVELSFTQRLWRGMNASGWVSYNDAALTEPFPVDSTTFGAPGARLPYAPEWSGNISLDQDFPIGDDMLGHVEAVVTYVGDRIGIFRPAAAPTRQTFPSYTQIDLRAGVRFASWNLNVFANNVADKRGVLSGGIGQINPLAFTQIQPRTIGVSLSKTFSDLGR